MCFHVDDHRLDKNLGGVKFSGCLNQGKTRNIILMGFLGVV
ncbi:hypothetical protein GCWU000324_00125 [Kingella oralis ATCC 51147]|uniref:Uncharacterized protein n=1 Tax=Kingella oralis ATCC 51147 TaxID=629741 RepID=C4GEN9_9NEIS|nr:hypothetical protein GCWU000324_00125 [Kingella oralis ATCC 51147]